MSTMLEIGIRSTGLRKQAENVLKRRTTDLKKLPIDDAQKLVDELQIHQIELEMQNIELRRAQKELEDARNRYSDLYDYAPVGYFTFDKNGLILEVNLTGAKKLGIEKRNLINKPFSLYIRSDKDAFYSHLKEVFSNEEQMTCELRIVDKKGKIFDALLESMLLHDREGNLLVRTSMSDVTQRKQAEEALIESKERYGNIIEFSNDMIWTSDLSGRFQFCNRRSEEISGYKLEEWLNRDFFSLIMKEDLPNLMEIFNKVLRGQPQQYDATVKKRDGTPLILSINTAPLYSKGAMIGTVSFGRDITQHKREIEERTQILARENAALVEAQAARKLDQLKSMFIASTSHELRTPLNSIIGFSSMLLQGISGDLNPEQRFQLDIVHSAGKHLLLLISDVIDVSKIEAGKIDLKVSEFELKQVVDEAISTLDTNIKGKGLEVNVEVEDITLKTDKRRLLQCIFNLVGNAIKYTEKGSIKITAKTTGNRVDISVTDTGIGIKNEDIPKLFASFVRLQTPLTENTQGTGLGLYLVKKLAKDHLGGDVEVESEYGVGSKFTLNIPIELEEQGCE